MSHVRYFYRASRLAAVLAAGAGLLLAAADARAAAFLDPTNDFLDTYRNAVTQQPLVHAADLDVVGGSVTFDGAKFTLNATVAGVVGTTTTDAAGNPIVVAYVWGMNHGTGTSVLDDGAPNHKPGLRPDILIDDTLIVKANGQMFYQLAKAQHDGDPAPAPVLYNAGNVTISNDGHTISGSIALADIKDVFNAANAGFKDPLDYTFTLWPKLGQGGNNIIADFSPTVTAGSVPEPATWAMMIAGFGLAGGMARRRRSLAA